MTTPDGIVKQASWYPLLLFSKYMRGHTVGVHLRGTSYTGVTQPEWLQGSLDDGAAWLDVSASINDEGILSLAVVNISDDKDFEVDLKGVNGEVDVYTVTGSNVKAVNTTDKEEVGLLESKWDGQGKFAFKKHSMTMLRWKA
jgi:alpha-N-arabinofuranosidase